MSAQDLAKAGPTRFGLVSAHCATGIFVCARLWSLPVLTFSSLCWPLLQELRRETRAR